MELNLEQAFVTTREDLHHVRYPVGGVVPFGDVKKGRPQCVSQAVPVEVVDGAVGKELGKHHYQGLEEVSVCWGGHTNGGLPGGRDEMARFSFVLCTSASVKSAG